ncbi:hypothetical protein [Nocardia sp. NPDC049707]|uniref:hypothetical protein n=1 Tax=Nocardia sp. NPDC049707 TaxID=3154735 RepID=UPI003425C63E
MCVLTLAGRRTASREAGPGLTRGAAQRMALSEGFHGGDAGLRDGLYRMQAGEVERLGSELRGPSAAQIEFITAANTARR